MISKYKPKKCNQFKRKTIIYKAFELDKVAEL